MKEWKLKNVVRIALVAGVVLAVCFLLIKQPKSLAGAAYELTGPTTSGNLPIARADLAACEQVGLASIQDGKNLETAEVASLLQGTWVGGLTWRGVPLPAETLMYFDFRGSQPTAMMYDKVGLGTGPLTQAMRTLTDSLDARAVTPSLAFLNCEGQLRYQFFKLSDDFLFDGIGVSPARGAVQPLRSVWTQLAQRNHFDPSVLGGLPPGLSTTPGSEVLTPSLLGAFWRASLASAPIAERQGVVLHLQGEYNGSYHQAGEESRLVLHFFKDGNLIAAAAEYPAPDTNSQLVEYQRVVLFPGVQPATSGPASGPTAPTGGSDLGR